MADMVKNDGNVFVPNQLPPAQPQPSGPQLVQQSENGPLYQSIAAMFNQNNSGVQEMLKGNLKSLGISQIVTGIISIIIGIVQICILHRRIGIESISVIIGTPWWTGVLFVAAGALAVAAEKERTQCMIKGCLSMNIISAIICFPAIIIYSINLSIQPSCYSWAHCYRSGGSTACMAILLLLTLLNAAISIAVSSFNCKAINGCCGTPVPVIVVYSNVPAQPIPQQQFQVNPPPYNMALMENVHVG
ncbi:membrane-spanning 4-domains subfamily A member 8-like [Scyliorhinus canicula]|uniref:membrane-spanning 4-domains subfamily A member 8-like n=1 Tax=Scyliorhinus canicula TaxID=7830 RepID=UPI0018F7766D|nr:membrane-spanning 4-domains subfamily A member 8-like [Scyliorhinus canicula]